MSKILVTGGAGFIGSHVVEAYLNDGHEIVVIDNLSTGKREYLPNQTKFYQIDITSAQEVQQLVANEKPDVINHHAAHIQVGYSVQDPIFDAQNNILGTINLLEAAQQAGTVKQIIFASTGGAMYGNQPTPFREDMPALPLSPYGVSKRSAELYLNYYQSQYHINYVVLRYANVYGPRQNPHGESGVVAIFLEKIMKGEQPVINGKGTNTRDYVHVKDVARANLSALQFGNSGIFNIGTGIETSANEVFNIVAKHSGYQQKAQHGPARPGEQQTSSLDSSLAKQKLSWEPTVSFEDGVADLCQQLGLPAAS